MNEEDFIYSLSVEQRKFYQSIKHLSNEKIKALEEDGKMLDWIEKCRIGEIEPPSDYPITTMNLRQAIRNAMEKGQ